MRNNSTIPELVSRVAGYDKRFEIVSVYLDEEKGLYIMGVKDNGVEDTGGKDD